MGVRVRPVPIRPVLVHPVAAIVQRKKQYPSVLRKRPSYETDPNLVDLEDFSGALWKPNISRTYKTLRKRLYYGKKLSILKIRRKVYKETGVRGRKAARIGIAKKRERKARTKCKHQERAA